MGPKIGLECCGYRCPQRDSIPGPSSPQQVAIPTTNLLSFGPSIILLCSLIRIQELNNARSEFRKCKGLHVRLHLSTLRPNWATRLSSALLLPTKPTFSVILLTLSARGTLTSLSQHTRNSSCNVPFRYVTISFLLAPPGAWIAQLLQ